MDYDSFSASLASLIDGLADDELSALASAIARAEQRICRELDELNFRAGL